MLEVSNLSKDFDGLLAVDNISFSAQAGEVLGMLGPNGAGKSTTMRIITGFLEPSSGSASIHSNPIGENTLEAQVNLGYVPENAPLYDDMYVREFLRFVGKIRGLENSQLESRLDQVLKTCSLESVEFQKIETLSKGFRRRVSLAQSLIHDPKVLILDEPTDGLDPNQKYDVRKLIKQLSKTKCILVSTHILEEVEEICDRCIIIGEGKKLFEGTPDQLRSKSKQKRIQDVFRAITTGEKVTGVLL